MVVERGNPLEGSAIIRLSGREKAYSVLGSRRSAPSEKYANASVQAGSCQRMGQASRIKDKP